MLQTFFTVHSDKLKENTTLKVKEFEAKSVQTVAEIKKFYEWDMFSVNYFSHLFKIDEAIMAKGAPSSASNTPKTGNKMPTSRKNL